MGLWFWIREILSKIVSLTLWAVGMSAAALLAYLIYKLATGGND